MSTPHTIDNWRDDGSTRAVRYAAGDGTVVAGPVAVGLIAGSPEQAPVAAFVRALLEGADLDRTVDVLSGLGIRSLPDFALVFTEPEGLRVLVRGGACIKAGSPGAAAPTNLGGGGASTWFETVVPHQDLRLCLAGAVDDAAASFVLVTGSAPACTVHLGAGAGLAAPVVDARSMGEPDHVADHVPAPVPDQVPQQVPERPPAPLPEPVPVEPARPIIDEVVSEQPRTDAVDPAEHAAPLQTDAPVAAVGARLGTNTPPPDKEAGSPDDFDFGHLLGATVYRGVEDAAIRTEADDLTSAAPAPTTPLVTVVPGPSTDAVAGQPTDEPPLDARDDEPPVNAETRVYDATDPPLPTSEPVATGLISAVPGGPAVRAEAGERFVPSHTPVTTGTAPPTAGTTAAEPPSSSLVEAVPAAPHSAPAPTPAPSGLAPVRPLRVPKSKASDEAPAPPAGTADIEPEDLTVSVAELRARHTSATTPSGPTLQAVHCVAGHPNPPHADRCRSCGKGIEDRTVRTIARPSLGELHFAHGEVIALQQPVVVGRKPPEGATVGGEPALGVRVPDPESLLSRTHVEVRLVDWQVQIVDRDSVNHTFVELPGLPPTQLRPGEPFPIPPGTTVRLGDEASFSYQVGA